jgi:hypothetical protein
MPRTVPTVVQPDLDRVMPRGLRTQDRSKNGSHDDRSAKHSKRYAVEGLSILRLPFPPAAQRLTKEPTVSPPHGVMDEKNTQCTERDPNDEVSIAQQAKSPAFLLLVNLQRVAERAT